MFVTDTVWSHSAGNAAPNQQRVKIDRVSMRDKVCGDGERGKFCTYFGLVARAENNGVGPHWLPAVVLLREME